MVHSDHLPLEFSLPIGDVVISKPNAEHKQFFLFNKANWDEINYHLSQAPLMDSIIDNIDNLDLAWAQWKLVVLKVLRENVATKLVKNKNSSPWIDAEVIHNSNIKKRLFHVAKHSNNPNDWDFYKRHSNRLKNMVYSKYNNFLNDIYTDMDINPKKFLGSCC